MAQDQKGHERTIKDLGNAVLQARKNVMAALALLASMPICPVHCMPNLHRQNTTFNLWVFRWIPPASFTPEAVGGNSDAGSSGRLICGKLSCQVTVAHWEL